MTIYIRDWILKINSNYNWYISGTPFCNPSGIENSFKFIKLNFIIKINTKFGIKKLNINTNDKIFNSYHFFGKKYIMDQILSNICIRHLKSDITDQINIPGYDNIIIWLNLTDIEQKLYNSQKRKNSPEILQQMCCHPLIANSYKSIIGHDTLELNKIRDKLISYHETNKKKYKNKITNLNSDNQAYSMLKMTYQNKINESKYILSILKKIKNQKEIILKDNCTICFDNISEPLLTPCGHMFCHKCIKTCLKNKQQCPICKKDLTNTKS